MKSEMSDQIRFSRRTALGGAGAIFFDDSEDYDPNPNMLFEDCSFKHIIGGAGGKV